MIINGLPARFKLLPLVVLAFVLVASYFYFFDGNAIDTYYQNHLASHGSSDAASGPVTPAKEEAQQAPSTPYQAGGGQHGWIDKEVAEAASPHGSAGDGTTQQSTAYSNTNPEAADGDESSSHGSTSSSSSSSKSSSSKGSASKGASSKGGSSTSPSSDPDSQLKSSTGSSSDSSHPDSAALYSDSGSSDDTSSSTSSSSSTADKSTHPSSSDISGSSVKRGSVVMVTASHGTKGFQGIPDLKNMVYENRRSYAHKHGYEFMWADITSYNISDDTPLYWNKIPVLREAFQRFPHAEWIWWMDLDIIIMNSTLSMWDHVLSPEAMTREVVLGEMLKQPGGADSGWRTPESFDYDDVFFMISSGGWGMNVGNFLMRRSAWSDWLLNIWIDPLYIKQGWTFPENDAWTHMYRSFPIVRRHTVCTNQRALNAYPAYNTLGKHWQEGDHTVHFAGCGAHASCPTHWAEYWAKREQLPIPAFIKQQIDDGTAEIESVKMGEGLPG